ncbi:TrbC/VirB2 family protein [Wolbachia pipientis]|nr:TrbC/VirB2 family protein [Wolbachia pipientis]MDM8334985.1 TrbC/VirB2 family protein [Wolbachia pipientis]
MLSCALDTNAASKTSPTPANNETSTVICKIIDYTHSLGGPMIMIVITGAALLAIFSRMLWPALFVLDAFTAVFFVAPAVVKAIKQDTMVCR